MWNYSKVITSLKSSREALISHSLYSKVNSIANARVFLKSHAYAVWDFMSLLKSMQQKLTVTRVPWVPCEDPAAAHFVNMIVSTEESDNLFNDPSKAISHFELYLIGMKELQSFTEPIQSLLTSLNQNTPFDLSFAQNTLHFSKIIPVKTLNFTKQTLNIAINAPTHIVASYFLFGREDPIPDMFKTILAEVKSNKIHAPSFEAYLKRHIQLDSADHGPISENIIKRICGDDSKMWKEVYEAAEQAIQSRIILWDGIEEDLKKKLTLYEVVGGKETILGVVKRKRCEIEMWGVETGFEEWMVEFLGSALGGPERIGGMEGNGKIKAGEMAEWIVDGIDLRGRDEGNVRERIEAAIRNCV